MMAWRQRWDRILPHLVIWPPLLVSCAYVLVFSVWTTWVSFTRSTLLPDYSWAGVRNYTAMLASRNWQIAFTNLFIYGACFVVLAMAVGLLLAVLIDQRIRGENLFRTIFLYPIAVSFVVTGTVWGWLFNPSIGVQKLVHDLGWTSFRFDWVIDRNMAIYTIVVAAVWHGSGFAMALFLAGLRSVDADLVKAAQIDGAGAWRIYTRVVLPTIGPIFVAVLVMLLQFAIKTYDLVVALTAGGPGLASTLPALVVYDFMFQRGELGRGAAAAVMLLGSLTVVLIPYAGFRAWQNRRGAARV
ncbi:carbohydrate ABC transporter permease [Limobrevibacterium gyesilva]|uniref:Sugar ABC transporter permease n=1 Tax=Limobrevibacterium gyesilva TaxID=2991712 RepID=A0AA42CE71_9PROT|nr:sugar ABC transporter permease [Limobrevibacterium gyesilva]MCW3474904.1 sugar ABC transporter permease [Limobrevibacterium gyesilva]